MKEKAYYKDKDITLYQGDCLKILKKLPEKSVDMIFADPPYFLSNDGISVSGGKQVSVNKADWDKGGQKLKDKHTFNKRWIYECKRVLKDNGTIWVSGTMHNIYSVGIALEENDFKILNNITWKKLNPPPNLACRCFTHSTETILWAKKICKNNKHFFNYALMKELNGGKQMKDVWEGSLTPKREKMFGKHPTQKPEYLLERIILASSKEDFLILDPFNGSGTTGVVAKKMGRKYIGIDLSEEYLNITIQRLNDLNNISEERKSE